jgi:ribosomal protein L11 methyltransferase
VEAGHVTLLAYFPDAPDLHAALSAALASLPDTRLEPTEVPDVDWVARFREGFRGVHAGGFRIVPHWDAPPAPLMRKGAVILVDPGRAFGTGTHESTRLCLELLRELSRAGQLGRVLDLGTGSGILAVAAARLGARPVIAVDLDPESMTSAREHARLNGTALHLVRGDLAAAVRPGPFDLVLANIAAPLLIERAAEIRGLGAPTVILSGLLTTDVADVVQAYSPAPRIEVRQDGEWAAVMVLTGTGTGTGTGKRRT